MREGQYQGWDGVLRRLGGAFALGAALGTALDAIHAYGDVEHYPHAALGRLGWFVPLEFGLAGVASALALGQLERRLGKGTRWSGWERAREVPVLAGLYMTSVGANGQGNAALAVGLLVLVAARLVFAPAPGDWVLALLAGIAGPAAEATIHALGAFRYTEPDVLGLPLWLAPLWANGGLAIRRLFAPFRTPRTL
jgi:Protein of unknown function (DUF2878)